VHCRYTTIDLPVNQRTTFAKLRKDLAERFGIPPAEQILLKGEAKIFQEPALIPSSSTRNSLMKKVSMKVNCSSYRMVCLLRLSI